MEQRSSIVTLSQEAKNTLHMKKICIHRIFIIFVIYVYEAFLFRNRGFKVLRRIERRKCQMLKIKKEYLFSNIPSVRIKHLSSFEIAALIEIKVDRSKEKTNFLNIFAGRNRFFFYLLMV